MCFPTGPKPSCLGVVRLEQRLSYLFLLPVVSPRVGLAPVAWLAPPWRSLLPGRWGVPCFSPLFLFFPPSWVVALG